MDMRKERRKDGSGTGWSAVPQFGDWESKSPGSVTNYSMVFSQAREQRKQHKKDVRRASFGNDQDLMAAAVHHEDPVIRKKRILTYINCCIRP